MRRYAVMLCEGRRERGSTQMPNLILNRAAWARRELAWAEAQNQLRSVLE